MQKWLCCVVVVWLLACAPSWASMLVVSSSPNAQIYVNGEFVGVGFVERPAGQGRLVVELWLAKEGRAVYEFRPPHADVLFVRHYWNEQVAGPQAVSSTQGELLAEGSGIVTTNKFRLPAGSVGIGYSYVVPASRIPLLTVYLYDDEGSLVNLWQVDQGGSGTLWTHQLDGGLYYLTIMTSSGNWRLWLE